MSFYTIPLESSPHQEGRSPSKVRSASQIDVPDQTVFGHDKVSILDGGLPRWIAEGGDVEVNTPEEAEGLARSSYKGGEDKSVDCIRCERGCFFLSLADGRGYLPTPSAYQQVVDNSRREPGDSSAEIVLDHRPLARSGSSL